MSHDEAKLPPDRGKNIPVKLTIYNVEFAYEDVKIPLKRIKNMPPSLGPEKFQRVTAR
jgi:hypothetical protein